MTTPIPQPPSIPFIGNVTSIDKEIPLRSFLLLAQKYGEIYQLNIMGNVAAHVNTHAFANEVSNEARFRKIVAPSLKQVRNIAGDGLFTAHNDEPNWAIAHRLLMPAFGTASIRGMFDDMKDIASQLLLKWERFGPESIIDPSDDFTRVALDTLAFCTMSYRLNSFYSESPPAFARAMADALKESFLRTTRPSVVQALVSSTTAKYQDDIKLMRDLADKLVADRKAHPTEKKDLLNTMLYSKDPKTGEGLSDENISHNLLTFLIAGHETSSGTLSFIIYYLLKHPEAMRKLQAEIDEVIGDREIQYEDLGHLHYLIAVMRETLRLSPTASGRSVASDVDTTLGNGKYAIKANIPIVLQLWAIHRDPLVWGEDAMEWRPERMLDGKFEALPRNAWQPFGFGARACLGRPFAWQEIQLVMASVVQKFDLSLVDPSYTLELKQTLTVKPKDFYIHATVRNTRVPLYSTPSSTLKAAQSPVEVAAPTISPSGSDAWKPLYVLYGSNTGTSESFAQRIVSEAPSYGFKPSIGTLDSAVDNMPKDGPILIITASFEGQPADNAAKFVDWLTNLKDNELSGIQFAIYGCGNRDWVQTYQRIPKLCDELLGKLGGQRLLTRGEGDAGASDFFPIFDQFETRFWETLAKEYATSRQKSPHEVLEVKTLDSGTERAVNLRQPDVALGQVIENRVLTKPGAPVKRHLEFKLPEGFTFRAGDYLSILPHNPPRMIRRALAWFGLSQEQQVVLSSLGPTSLPVGKPVNLYEIFSGYVELSQPATIRDLRILLEAAEPDETRAILSGLTEAYTEQVLGRRLSVLDILEKHPGIKLPLSSFLFMLPPMRVRQYSISSSPLSNPQHVTLTISVLSSPAYANDTHQFLGVASNYLASLVPGDRVQIAVRPSATAFHPPADPKVPIVMFCAGAGLAPMRGFIQERAMQKTAGREVGKTLLFFGCRSPNEDYLYSDGELGEWAKLGVVDVHPAFSRSSGDSEGCKYVQDRIWHDRADITQAYQENAKFFTCGSAAVAKGIKSKLVAIIQSRGLDEAQATAKFDEMTQGRYATDVFD